MAYPVVDEEKCVGCEECVDICPVDVFEMENEKSVVARPEDCEECESCVETCEEGAIQLTED
jgi:NAD-dependent dihydropyrimidine dehydrogenase PreA subunit